MAMGSYHALWMYPKTPCGAPLRHEMMEKILDLERAVPIIRELKARGKKVVFTNGCFDIVHSGHVQYLSQARSLGDFLVVGINDDHSVRSIKGEGRPILPLEDRALVLAALECVDMVIPFGDPDPLRIIKAIGPHFLVKGADWPEEAIVGAQWVRSIGGEVVRVPLRAGISTSEIIRRILSRFGTRGPQLQRDPPGY
jgi:D-beta-D-heptose 7-phosphate kinase/D-beta-D-heptose 1-phosphate adenosyltransferase